MLKLGTPFAKTIRIVPVVILCTVALACAGAGQRAAKFGEIPDGTVIISEEMIEKNPSVATLRWPSEDEIRELRAKALDGTVFSELGRETMAKMIRAELTPSDVVKRFVPLRKYVKGCDALVTRYRHDGFLVQILVTSARMRMAVREEQPRARSTEKDQFTFVREVIRKFYREADVVLGVEHHPVRKGGGLEGGVRRWTKDEAWVRWYETLRWWTDGHVICFSACKSPGSSGGCVEIEDWFAWKLSVWKGLRRGWEKLTPEMIDKVLGERPED